MKKLLRNSMLSLGFVISGSAFAQNLCTVSFDAANSWGNGAQMAVEVVNNGPSLSGWELGWSYANGEQIQNLWNGSVSQSGAAVTVTDAGYNGNVASGATFSFGFIVNNFSTSFPVAFTLNGQSCNGMGSSSSVLSSSSLSSSSSSSSSSANSSVNNTGGLAWTLSDDTSFKFITVKKEHTAEVHTFDAIDGSVSANGAATLAIDLASVNTNNATRDGRMQNILFETGILPKLYYTTQLDLSTINNMSVGSTQVVNIEGTLSLHGVSKTLSTDVLVVKADNNNVSVSNVKPILVKASDFDLAGGVDALRAVASLTSVSQVVPVYFRLELDANSDPNAFAINVPSAPAAPTSLSGVYDANAAEIDLTWNDNSDNEGGFIIRNLDANGYWVTAGELLINTENFTDLALNQGDYSYKVIAFNGSIPSAPTNTLTVTVGQDGHSGGDTGADLYQAQCAQCHGDDGDGFPIGVALDQPRDLQSMISYIENNMPIGDASACDADCALAIGEFIEAQFWEDDTQPLVCDTTSYGARQLKLLTRDEFQNSVEDLMGVNYDVALGLAADTVVGYFINNTQKAVVGNTYDSYLSVAKDIAQWSADRNFSGTSLSCGNNFNQTCANGFVGTFLPKVFRRSLEGNEASTYAAMANGSMSNGDVKAGIQLALEAALSSPQFLYRSEIGERNTSNSVLDADAYELTSYEMATWLAYTFTGSTPDDTALQKARNNQLRSEAQIRQEAQRLLATSAAKEKMGDFVGGWLGTDELENAPKNAASWPGFAAVIPYMEQEIREVFAHVMLDEEEQFASLYSANYTFVNGPLAQHYGINGVSGNSFQQVTTSNRGGILANGAFMARWAEDVETSPIRRSVRVRRRMLCQDQPDPPAGVALGREQALAENAAILNDPSTTNRLKYDLITSSEQCSACHREWINPLGFGMEDFDPAGNPRTTDLRGNAIDASGQLYAPENLGDKDVFVGFDGTRGLGELIATLPNAQQCVPQNMFRFAVGVGVEGIDVDDPEGPQLAPAEETGYACAVQNLTNTMMTQSPRAMLESMGTLDAIRYRKAWAR